MSLRTVEDRIREAGEYRRSLPCYDADPDQHDGQGSDREAAAACTAAGTWKDCAVRRITSPYVGPVDCARARLEHACTAAHSRLLSAGVPSRETGILLADLRLDGRLPLVETAAIRSVREMLSMKPRPALVALAGNVGVGKTVAACWALSKVRGRYALAAEIIRPGYDLDGAKGAEVLVCDQLGREYIGASDWGLSVLEELLDARYAARLVTILVGNLTRPQWEARYGAILADRLRGDGVWFQLNGRSLRGAR